MWYLISCNAAKSRELEVAHWRRATGNSSFTTRSSLRLGRTTIERKPLSPAVLARIAEHVEKDKDTLL
jgi:5-carboxymethyl-2-hydroxymuconate isomerase